MDGTLSTFGMADALLVAEVDMTLMWKFSDFNKLKLIFQKEERTTVMTMSTNVLFVEFKYGCFRSFVVTLFVLYLFVRFAVLLFCVCNLKWSQSIHSMEMCDDTIVILRWTHMNIQTV